MINEALGEEREAMINEAKLRDIAFIIADESNSIMNVKLPNLSVNYGSVY